MYNLQDVANRIKLQAKQQNISIKQLLSDCNLGKNTVVNIANGADIYTLNLAKIADYLNISIDYLLGRNPTQQITVKNANDNIGVVGQANAPVTIHNNTKSDLSVQEQDLLRIYNAANGKQQMKIMDFIYQIEEEFI